jgi:hypothetical protein
VGGDPSFPSLFFSLNFSSNNQVLSSIDFKNKKTKKWTQ